MGNVISLDAVRKSRNVGAEIRLPDPNFRRSAEMALIIEMIKALPKGQRSKMLSQVMMMSDRFPDCTVAKDAGYIAALMSEWSYCHG